MLPFIEECRGGLGGRVECVCLALVNSLETLAVAWEVSAIGVPTVGLSKRAGFGSSCSRSFPFGSFGGLFWRIVRKLVSVRSTSISLSSEDSDDDEGSSMIGGVSHLRGMSCCRDDDERAERAGE